MLKQKQLMLIIKMPLTIANRFESAYKTGGVKKQQLDARINMINAKSRLTQANINVGDTRVKAPSVELLIKNLLKLELY